MARTLRRLRPTSPADPEPDAADHGVSIANPRRGRLEEVTPDGRILISLPGLGLCEASFVHGLTNDGWLDAVQRRAEVAISWLEGENRPLILGLLHDRLQPRATSIDVAPVREIVASESLTLACGESRLTLRRDGRVTIEGTQVEADAAGALVLQGANVRIN